MSLTKGDHLVIKRNGMILTPDVGEGHHEFEVVDPNVDVKLVWADGTPCPTDTKEDWWKDKAFGVDYYQIKTISIKVIR